MSICKFTNGNSIYLFDPNKISYIHSIIRAGSTTSDVSSESNRAFMFFFDNQESISISFQTHTEGMNWIEDNLMSGECPSTAHL